MATFAARVGVRLGDSAGARMNMVPPGNQTHIDDSSLGFLLHVFHRQQSGAFTIVGVGKLESGQTFGLVDDRAQPAFYVRLSDADVIRSMREADPFTVEPVDWKTMDGESVARVICDTTSTLRRSAPTRQTSPPRDAT